MNNRLKFLAIGLVLGGGIGIVAGSVMDNIPMGIVFGGGFGLITGLAIGAALDRRTESQARSITSLSRVVDATHPREPHNNSPEPTRLAAPNGRLSCPPGCRRFRRETPETAGGSARSR
ncbi:MAG: hypothetical protein GTO63_29800 [Anaerolineae bacterium]|nr:hypothetical protein [Anaerolineae bacterium]NIN98910.1 hypothetical protein [Anaerolineae bacterium]